MNKVVMGFLVATVFGGLLMNGGVSAGEEALHDLQYYKRSDLCNGGGKAEPIPRDEQGSRIYSRYAGTGCGVQPASSSTQEVKPIKVPYLYRRPHENAPSVADYGKSCVEIQQEMNRLQPMTYQYKPGFNDDPYNRAAIWTGALVAWPFYGVIGLTEANGFKEDGRIELAQNRLEELRDLKAQKHCFER